MTKTDIRNRIKEVRRVRFGDVRPHEHNFRRHPKQQRAALEGVVSEVGFASVPLAYHSPRNGGALTWLDGHLRSEAFPDYEGDVGVLDVDDAEAALLLATLDPLAALATHDAAALDELLRDVQTGDAAVQAMLADLAESVIKPEDADWAAAFGGLPDEDRAPFQQMTFTLHDTQAEVVKRAIAAAQRGRDFAGSPNENGNGNALWWICQGFLGANGGRG